MKIQVETLNKSLIEECMPLLLDNYKESGHLTEPLDIHWDAYLAIKDAFVPMTLREVDNTLRGVLFFSVSLYSHVATLVIAQQITFYIQKNRRFFTNAMIEFSEEYFHDKHVDFIVQSARYGSRFCNVLEKKGYTPTDVQYLKRLG